MEIRDLLHDTEKRLKRSGTKKKGTHKRQYATVSDITPFPFKDKYTQAIDDFRDAIVLYVYVFAEIKPEEAQEWARDLYRITVDVISLIAVATWSISLCS